MDQAEGLRTLLSESPRTSEKPLASPEGQRNTCPRVIAITSGKGGVGKTNVVANLAFAFTRMGKKVLVLDADLGLANIDVLLGLIPQYNIEHLLRGEKNFQEILIRGPGGMSVMPASSGVLDLVDLDENQKVFLLNEIDLVNEKFDLLLIDTGAGISSNVLYFNISAQESIIIATPEPTSLTDAYALIKVLYTKFNKKEFLILINWVRNSKEAEEVFRKISQVADRYLGTLSIDYLGFIPFDEKISLAVKHQRPVLEHFPQAPSSQSFMKLARVLWERPIRSNGAGTIQFFWRQLLSNNQNRT